MKNQPTKLDNVFKVSISLGIVLFASSLFYYFMIRPFSKDWSLKRCLREAENQYNQDRQIADNNLQLIYGERSTNEDKKQELEKKEKELVAEMNEKMEEDSYIKQELEKKKKEIIDRYKKESEEGSQWAKLHYTVALRQDYILENEVRKKYYEENLEYLEVEKELGNLRKEIDELNEKVSNLKNELTIDELDKKLKEAKNYCIKIY